MERRPRQTENQGARNTESLCRRVGHSYFAVQARSRPVNRETLRDETRLIVNQVESGIMKEIKDRKRKAESVGRKGHGTVSGKGKERKLREIRKDRRGMGMGSVSGKADDEK